MVTKDSEVSGMECLQELESTFDYGKELQKQSAVVAVKLREIKAARSTLLYAWNVE